MKDRLIKLKRQAINYAQEKADERGGLVCIDDEVDYLLANGVIVPPCKVGDKLYNKYSLTDDCCYWEVIKFEVYDDEIWIIDDSDNCYGEKEIGKTVFLTKEEAEEKLKELKENGN